MVALSPHEPVVAGRPILRPVPSGATSRDPLVRNSYARSHPWVGMRFRRDAGAASHAGFDAPQRATKAPKPPKPRKVEKRRKGRKG